MSDCEDLWKCVCWIEEGKPSNGYFVWLVNQGIIVAKLS